MAGFDRRRGSVVTPRSVAVLVGGACLLTLALAVVDSEAVVPADPRLILLGLGLLGLGLAAGVLRARRYARLATSRWGGYEHELTIDEDDIRELLHRWYPNWQDRHLARVAAAISYHRRRREAHD